MMMKFQVFGILLFLLYTLSYPSLLVFSSPSSSFPKSSSSSQLCHHHDKVALLQFINGFTIDPQFSYDESSSYPKTKSWKEDRDCCLWDGVTCDTVSGHVIGLDLSFSQLGGIIHQNSTLFHLSHLQSLNLAYNAFYPSHISPNMANFAGLKSLNLSYSVFTGDVPINLGLLSQLISLDLSSYNNNNELEMSNIDKIMRNLTSLRELILNSVSINSAFPQAVANLSSLSSLDLFNCNLQGSFPSNIFTLPHLQSLIVDGNHNLYIDASHFSNLSSSLEFIDFHDTNLTGKLPEYSLGSQPPQLRTFVAYGCNLYGNIPMWIWNTTEVISLGFNNLSGKLPSSVNTKHLSGLTGLYLGYNLLNGTIPSWLMNLPSLMFLALESNQFTGEVPEPFPKGNCFLKGFYIGDNNLSLQLNFLSKCNNLEEISLYHTSLIGVNNSTFFWPNLSYVDMSSCNITSFPNFLHYSKLPLLRELDLSYNKIQGEIPTWFFNVGKDSLSYLNISHNNLTGGLHLRSWKYLDRIDIRSNSLQGLLPLPPPNTAVFLASNNKFHGEINSSFCELQELQYLDLSNNSLDGMIPKCLGKLSLQLLDLSSNIFRGIIPMTTFSKECSLQSIHLNNNEFEGKVPRSLKRCKALEVLDLGNNQLNDTFPHALGTLPHLKVLVLRSNHFQGLIKYHPKAHIKPFPKLQILDISRNQFCGKLPTRYIENFKAMMVSNNVGANNNSDRYIGMSNDYSYYYYYHDSLVLTVKGIELSYERILSIFASLDFSSNNFSGEIPNSIGQLVTLRGLNISHNNLTGHIPPCLASLSSLEFLDLSCNKLKGEIPPQLVRLTFLEVFNVSNNKLDGPIPQGSQFGTFLNDSYEGNLGLCGDPMPKCGEHGGAVDHQPTTPESQEQGSNFIDIITSISLCEIILLGFGLGTVLGSSIGYCMLSARKSNWLSRKADRFEGVMVKRFKKRSGRKQRT